MPDFISILLFVFGFVSLSAWIHFHFIQFFQMGNFRFVFFILFFFSWFFFFSCCSVCRDNFESTVDKSITEIKSLDLTLTLNAIEPFRFSSFLLFLLFRFFALFRFQSSFLFGFLFYQLWARKRNYSFDQI